MQDSVMLNMRDNKVEEDEEWGLYSVKGSQSG